MIGLVEPLDGADAARMARCEFLQRGDVVLQPDRARLRQSGRNQEIELVTGGSEALDHRLRSRAGSHRVAKMGDAEIFEVIDHQREIVVAGPPEPGMRVDADGVDEAAGRQDCLIGHCPLEFQRERNCSQGFAFNLLCRV
ncbi:hypothetical protein AB7M16_002365 [Bradyrhizobium sp. USDA 372]